MRHKKLRYTLGLKEGHRNALLSNMSVALITNKRITTTEAKAKALSRFMDKMISKAKARDLNAWRNVARHIRDRSALKELFYNIVPGYEDREGGYTRIVHVGRRLGDGARMAIIELIGYEEEILKREKKEKEEKAERKKRRREERERMMAEEEGVPAEEEERKEEEAPPEKKPREKKRFFLFRRKKDKDPMEG